ncbi:Crp/Fnr family transcriptional regulator [Parabacteroides sp. PF5-9]|uniref:Crp/Fnr family transcriptional regulator n=1 Tax=Parabacteroides sp. PF5-9 TaxID=1742404 RepID=UPI002474C17B|nr:Crp/Fnr family transcriptional regulator [Parabacteroides sp. PF5-9]MDH6359146.1 CRP-like cAMP-binding protein [Parabacteroides sp. PF5-9]
MDQKKLIARSIARLIAPLSEAALNELAKILVCTEVKKNQLFLKEGEVSKQIGYVSKGIIRQFYYKNNKDITEHFAYEDGLFLCIQSFIEQKPTRVMVEALENTVVYGIPYEPLMELIAQDKELEFFYRRVLEMSLILSQMKTDSLRFETANERYNRLLREHPEVIRRVPLSHIASYLLMTPETLSRVRANLS